MVALHPVQQGVLPVKLGIDLGETATHLVLETPELPRNALFEVYDQLFEVIAHGASII